MVTASFYNCHSTGVSNTESFTCNACKVRLTAGCTIEGNITDDHVPICFKRCIRMRYNDDLTAGKTLADMVIGITDKTHCQTLWNKGTKRLTAAAFAVDGICIIFKCIAECIGNDRAKNRTGCTVHG